jgi:hypothetical protein
MYRIRLAFPRTAISREEPLSTPFVTKDKRKLLMIPTTARDQMELRYSSLPGGPNGPILGTILWFSMTIPTPPVRSIYNGVTDTPRRGCTFDRNAFDSSPPVGLYTGR